MTAIEKAAIELHTVLWKSVGDNDDWLLKIEYSDGQAADRLADAFNALTNAIHAEYPHLPKWPL
jgi:hypothetical protein